MGSMPRLVASALWIGLLLVGVACSDPDEPCEVLPGECPNACTGGDVLEGGVCGAPGDCACGFFCKAGTCSFYTGSNRDCLCGDVAMTAPGLPVLGFGSHVTDDLLIEVIADSSDQLDTPRDLAFNPDEPDQLWVANSPPDSAPLEGGHMVVLHDANTDSPSSQTFHQSMGGSGHFFPSPAAFAFGLPGELATIHETHGETPRTAAGTPDEFMGPVLQATTLGIFNAGHTSHLDMLHDSPLGMGIAWDHDRVYWVFDGFHASLTRYDFVEPPPDVPGGLGGGDHSDGIIWRYLLQDSIKRVAGVPSHMVMDHDTGLLYVADTGNARVAVLDTTTGSQGAQYGGFDQCTQHYYSGGEFWTHIDTNTVEFEHPSGVELHDGHLWVTDNATSRIYAISLDEAVVVDWLDTGLPAGSLMGITFDAEGRMYLVDALADQVLRVSAP